MYDNPMRIKKDIEELLAGIRATISDGTELIPGYTVRVDCTDTRLIAETKTEEIVGCGETLADFEVPEDTEATWDILAELFLWHLVGEHDIENLI